MQFGPAADKVWPGRKSKGQKVIRQKRTGWLAKDEKAVEQAKTRP